MFKVQAAWADYSDCATGTRTNFAQHLHCTLGCGPVESDNSPERPARRPEGLIVRKLLIFAVLASTVGCQSMSNPFAKKDKDRPRSAPDPLMSPDLDEQQRYGRSRFSYPEADGGWRWIGFASGFARWKKD